MKRVIILGGGYSVKEGIDKGLWEKIKPFELWSLNSVFKAMPYLPKKEIWVDIGFFKHEANNLRDLGLQGVELVTKERHNYKPISDKLTLYGSSRVMEEYYGKEAITKNKIYYGRMGLAGQFALSLAVAQGYDEIYLLGYDFGTTSNTIKLTHWYQGNINKLDIYSTGAHRPEVYLQKNNKPRLEIEDWEVYKKEEDVKIFNVSIGSHLTVFPRITYDTFFNMLEE